MNGAKVMAVDSATPELIWKDLWLAVWLQLQEKFRGVGVGGIQLDGVTQVDDGFGRLTAVGQCVARASSSGNPAE